MRVASIQFSRLVLFNSGGIEPRLISDMLRALPSDARVVGFGEDLACGTCMIHVTSKSFKEVSVGHRPPDIIAHFQRCSDSGQPMFQKLDISSALDQAQGCLHEWKEYVGAMHRYDYCTKCNVKKENA